MNGCVDFTLGTDGFATSKGGVSNLFPQRVFPDWCPGLLHPDSNSLLFCIVLLLTSSNLLSVGMIYFK